MTYKILLVEDEQEIHTFIRISLTAEGYQYIGAHSLEEARAQWQQQQPHLVILDLGLPDGDGSQLLQEIRGGAKTPVLILTARDQEDEKIRLLEAGANDYLTKPFGIRELITRIKVLARDLLADPRHSDPHSSDLVRYGLVALQHSTHQFWLSGTEISLTKKEFAFMGLLLETPGLLVKQSDLLQRIWGRTHVSDTHYLRVLISQLRKKLDDSVDTQKVIKTEPGIGYRLLASDHSENSS